MNKLTRTFSLLALVIATTAAGQPARSASFERMRVKIQETPVFPPDLIEAGVREGQVCIAFSVDLTGKVDDALAVAYTRPEFARVALAAVRRWTFDPARIGGQPIATASEVTLHFEVQGTVLVSMTGAEALSIWLARLTMSDQSLYPRTLRELDRLPTPVSAPSPVYPAMLAARGQTGSVTVNFYIDETGAVRLPAVEPGNDPDLAALAVVAIQKWKFEPPSAGGRRVLTKTSQVFHFRPATGSPLGAMANN